MLIDIKPEVVYAPSMNYLISSSVLAVWSGGPQFQAIDDPRVIAVAVTLVILYFAIFKITITTIYIALMVIMLLSIIFAGNTYTGDLNDLYVSLAIMSALFAFLKISKRS